MAPTCDQTCQFCHWKSLAETLTLILRRGNIWCDNSRVAMLNQGGSKLKKKAFSICLLASVLAAAPLLSAQQSQPPVQNADLSRAQINDAEIQLMRRDIRSQRKQVVAANLPLTEDQATRFWPVYEKYIAETVKINDLRYGLIKEYAQSYKTLTDQQADSFIKRWLGLDQQNAELRLKFIPAFENVISHKQTAMFFQIDHQLAMMIDLQLASQIPLVTP